MTSLASTRSPRAAHWYAACALAFAGFAVYGSLLPFEFEPRPLGAAWQAFRARIDAPFPARFSRSDLLANVLLFVPVGFCLAGSLLVDRRRTLTRMALAAVVIPLASAAVSVTAEFLQMFASDRVPSNLDIAAQLSGCVAGIGAWIVAGPAFTTWLRDTASAPQSDRLGRLLTAYAVAWMFVSLAPFDITVDLGDLVDRFQSGRINLVPFGGAPVRWPLRVWDAVAEFLSAVPLGVLTARTARGERRAPPGAAALGASLVLAAELAQLFITSHAADVTDLILGAAGVAAGVSIAQRMFAGTPSRHDAATSPIVSGWALAACGAWCLVLCLYHWQPYDFGIDPGLLRDKLARMSLLPFAAYRSGSYLARFNNLLSTLAVAMPLGVVAAFVLRRRRWTSGAVTIGWLSLATIVFGVLEAGQLFLPTRVPDPTDVLLGVAGTYAGLSLGRWLRGTLPGP